MKINQYSIAVLAAGIAWGSMGLFTRTLETYGIGSSEAITARCGIAALCFGIALIIKDPKLFVIKLRDLWCFIGTGLFSLLFFTFCYFNAIRLMTMSMAAILLYTAPAIVMILSAILFKEKMTKIKILALILAFTGCCLVSGIADGGLSVSVKGLLFGLGSGFGYALYTIFSRFAIMRGYQSNVINFYSCFFACCGSLLLWGPGNLIPSVQASAGVIPVLAGLGVFSCFLPYMLYTYGLTGLENGIASVFASLEPVVASLLGVIVYHEVITMPSFVGIVMVLAAVVLTSNHS